MYLLLLRPLRQRVRHRPNETARAVGIDHYAAEVAGDDRVQRPIDLEVLAAVGEVVAAVADVQRLVAIGERPPLDLVLVEVNLGHPVGDPVEQGNAIVVASVIVLSLQVD